MQKILLQCTSLIWAMVIAGTLLDKQEWQYDSILEENASYIYNTIIKSHIFSRYHFIKVSWRLLRHTKMKRIHCIKTVIITAKAHQTKIAELVTGIAATLHRLSLQQSTSHGRFPLQKVKSYPPLHHSSVWQPFLYSAVDLPSLFSVRVAFMQRLNPGLQMTNCCTLEQLVQLFELSQE